MLGFFPSGVCRPRNALLLMLSTLLLGQVLMFRASGIVVAHVIFGVVLLLLDIPISVGAVLILRSKIQKHLSWRVVRLFLHYSYYMHVSGMMWFLVCFKVSHENWLNTGWVASFLTFEASLLMVLSDPQGQPTNLHLGVVTNSGKWRRHGHKRLGEVEAGPPLGLFDWLMFGWMFARKYIFRKMDEHGRKWTLCKEIFIGWLDFRNVQTFF